MFKKLKFWFATLKDVVDAYEKNVEEFGFNPFDKRTPKRTPKKSVTSKGDV